MAALYPAGLFPDEYDEPRGRLTRAFMRTFRGIENRLYFPDRKLRRLGRPLEGTVTLRIVDTDPYHLWTVTVVENLERRKNRCYLGSGFEAIVNHYRVSRGMVFVFKIRTSSIIDFEICQGFLNTIDYGPIPSPPQESDDMDSTGYSFVN